MNLLDGLIPQIETLYPDHLDEIDHPFNSIQYRRRVEICQGALNDIQLQNSWENLKERFKEQSKGFNTISTDIELHQGTPGFRFGVEIVDSDDCKTVFYFVISLVRPLFSFYFLDFEKFPNGSGWSKQSLGPLKDKFLTFGLAEEYEMLRRGDLSSPTELDLPAARKIEFLLPEPRFHQKCPNEQWFVETFSSEAVKVFPLLERVPASVGEISLPTLAPKSVLPRVEYTVFDCLFIGDLYY